MAKAYELRNLELDEISLVDKGANRGAKVVLMKRGIDTEKGGLGSGRKPSGGAKVLHKPGSLTPHHVVQGGKTVARHATASAARAHAAQLNSVHKADGGATVVHKPDDEMPFHVMQDGKVQAKHPTKARANAHAERLNAEVGKGEEYWKRDFSQDQRDAMAESGEAMEDGSYPIKTTSDLKNAVQAYGRAKNPDQVKAHIKTRAQALGATELLPEDWKASKDAADGDPDEMDEMDEDEDKPSTFAEELLERRMGDILEDACDYIYALHDVIRETLQGDGMSEDDDPEEVILAAVKDFSAAMEAKVPQWLDGEVGKAGRKISAARMEKLKNLHKTLSEIIAEQEPNQDRPNQDMEDKTMSKIDVSKLDPAVRAHIESLEANAKVGQDAIAKAKKDAEDAAKAEITKAQKQAEEAEKIAKAERDARLNREYGEKVSVLKRLTVKADDAKVMREVDEKCSEAVAKRVWEILKGANEAMQSVAILTGQIGSTQGDDAGDDPVSKVRNLVTAVIAKSDGKIKEGDAMAKVFSDNPGLYAAYTAAVAVKV